MDSVNRKTRWLRFSGVAVGRVCSPTGKPLREVGSEGNWGTVINALWLAFGGDTFLVLRKGGRLSPVTVGFYFCGAVAVFFMVCTRTECQLWPRRVARSPSYRVRIGGSKIPKEKHGNVIFTRLGTRIKESVLGASFLVWKTKGQIERERFDLWFEDESFL